MGGKRPDQYAIAPGEAGASDYKTLPEVGQGKSSGDDTVTRDKQHVAGQVGHGGGPGQHFFDPKHPQPSHDANVHAGEGHAHAPHDGHAPAAEEGAMHADAPREREAEGTEDPRERGVGA